MDWSKHLRTVALLLMAPLFAACGGASDGAANQSGSDATPPMVSSTSPVNAATGVTLNSSVSATFSEAMKNSTLTAATFTLAPTLGGPAIAGTVSVAGNTATFTPSVALAASTQYTATITTGAQDAAGNALAANFTWSFTTGTSTAAAACPVAGPLALSGVASRTSGVAPLAVFIDATGTTSPVTTRPFHDVLYQWDFGDAGSGSWTNTPNMPNLSRNSASGPLAAHVFETPGTYTVTLTALDGTNTASCSVQITVQDPATAFAGMNTRCFSTSGNFAGCPAGAQQITSSDFAAALSAHAAPNRRLLFRGGETFTTGGSASLRANGPGTIGSYGTGKARLISSPSGGGILIVSHVSTPNLADWRLMDLELDGLSAPSSFSIRAEAGFDQLTFLRLDIHDIGAGFNFPAGFIQGSNTAVDTPHHLWDQLAIVDSTLRRIGGGAGNPGQGAYLSARRLMFMGSLVDDTTQGEHPVRIEHATRMVFNNNTLQGAPGAFGPRGSKETLTIRALNSSASANGGVAHYDRVFPGGVAVTEKILVSDNQFVISGYTGAAANDVNSQGDQRLKDFIFERNWYRKAAGISSFDVLEIRADEVTVRNEIIDTTGVGFHIPITLKSALPPLPGCPPAACMPAASNVRIYNNSFYSADAGDFTGVDLETGVSSVTIQNNLAYAPNATAGSFRMINAAALTNPTTCPVDGTGQTCNSGDAQLQSINPGWTIVAPMTPPTRFRPLAPSYAVNRGVTVPVFEDFFQTPRAAPHDIGAVNP